MTTRDQNRARFPLLAQWVDVTGGKLRFASDDAGEIGSIPKDPASWCEIENIPPPYVQPKGRWNGGRT